jgi:histidinol phosphatase-like enzyme (inositol monophosphatase family)
MSPRLEFALEIAYRAGRSTLASFNVGTAVEIKSDHSPVTAADRNAEALIRKAITQTYPGEAILGEEEGESGSGIDRWVVDPIDGTKSFICGVPLYGTLISFERDGEPLLGVAYFPALDQMVYAEKGGGAYCNGRKAHVSRRSDVSRSTFCSGGHNTMERCGRLGPFMRIAKDALATRTWGDAYGHALVATGRVEAMVDPLVARWDISAMIVIVEEAGGTLTDFKGGRNPSNQAISSNGHMHPYLLECFAD